MKEKQIQAGDVKLTYQESGDAQAPALVFAHSLFMSANDWNRIVESFQYNYRIIALNLRGHATSEWKGEYTFETMAEYLHQFLNALAIDQCILVGHSLGGIVSYFFAAHHPERVKALVLEEAPPPKPVSKPFNFGVKPKGKLPYDWKAITSVVDLLNNANPSWWMLAEEITAPTLVIGGGKTSHVPQEWNEALANAISKSRLVTLKGGHFVHNKYPKEFIREVKRFLQEVTEKV